MTAEVRSLIETTKNCRKMLELHMQENFLGERVLGPDEGRAKKNCIKQVVCVRFVKTTGSHYLMGVLGTLDTEKYQETEGKWDLQREKKLVDDQLMRRVMQQLRAVVDEGEEALNGGNTETEKLTTYEDNLNKKSQ
jgi:hypothetical protein